MSGSDGEQEESCSPPARSPKPPSIHPATYSAELVGPICDLLSEFHLEGGRLLDPFGGLGHRLAEMAGILRMSPTAVEIEQGYFLANATHPCVVMGDSTALRFPSAYFDAAVTSPAYPNGISDDFISREPSIRHTYAHRLRYHFGAEYRLHPNNTGGMSPRRSPATLSKFYEVNALVYAEVRRVLRPGAPFVVNVKDTLSVPFRQHTIEQLTETGFDLVNEVSVGARGLNHGKNRERKQRSEHLLVFLNSPVS